MSKSDGVEQTLTIREPFHGVLWISVSRVGDRSVRLVFSVQQTWDAEVLIDRSDAIALAEALDDHAERTVIGRTVDHAPAVLTAVGQCFAITVLRDRLSSVLTLGKDARTLRGYLAEAGAAG
jgi:hypothetical protein